MQYGWITSTRPVANCWASNGLGKPSSENVAALPLLNTQVTPRGWPISVVGIMGLGGRDLYDPRFGEWNCWDEFGDTPRLSRQNKNRDA